MDVQRRLWGRESPADKHPYHPGENRFLATPETAIPVIIAVDVWKTVPFMALLILAGLQTIPSDMYEAGAIDVA